jgi:hypothetical protein
MKVQKQDVMNNVNETDKRIWDEEMILRKWLETHKTSASSRTEGGEINSGLHMH